MSAVSSWRIIKLPKVSSSVSSSFILCLASSVCWLLISHKSLSDHQSKFIVPTCCCLSSLCCPPDSVSRLRPGARLRLTASGLKGGGARPFLTAARLIRNCFSSRRCLMQEGETARGERRTLARGLYGLIRAWKPPLCHKDTAKSKKCPWLGALGAISCVFMA